MVVPLVWNHDHNDPMNVLGHALLKNHAKGVRAYGAFNDTEQGRNAKMLVDHGDIKSLSIYANQLKQNGGDVVHGKIRELSLVLAGANPEAVIDSYMSHGNTSEEEGIIYLTQEICQLSHSEEENETAEEEKLEESRESEEKVNEEQKEKKEEETMPISHADESNETEEKTVKEVFDSMTEEQKNVVYAMIGAALEDAGVDVDDEEEEPVKHNVFDNDDREDTNVLSHAEVEEIFKTLRDLVA